MIYHNKIMNIQSAPQWEDQPEGRRVALKSGHASARHAAAEIAVEADDRIAALEALALELAGVIGRAVDLSDRRLVEDGQSRRTTECQAMYEECTAALSSPLLAELRAKEAGQ